MVGIDGGGESHGVKEKKRLVDIAGLSVTRNHGIPSNGVSIWHFVEHLSCVVDQTAPR